MYETGFSIYEEGWHGLDHRTAFSFLVNRVEHQNEPKRPQGGGRLGSFWCSTRPSADTGTDFNLHHGDQYLFIPKAELNTKTNPNGHHFVAVWVRFGVQLGSLEKLMRRAGADRATLPQ